MITKFMGWFDTLERAQDYVERWELLDYIIIKVDDAVDSYMVLRQRKPD